MSKQVFDLLTCMPGTTVEQIWGGSATSLENVGVRSTDKYIAFAKLLGTLAVRFVTGRRDDIVYTTIAPHGEAVLRDALVIATGRLLAKRVIIHIHTRGLEEIIAGRSALHMFTRWALRGTELISQSSDMINVVEKTDVFSRIHHLPNYVQDPGVPDTGVGKTLTLGFFGSLDPRKGVLRFVDVLASLKTSGIPFKARIAGRATPALNDDDIAKYAREQGVADDLKILGFLSDESIITDFFDGLDIFIYPTNHDLAPLVLLEAMANAVVPVAFDTGAIREMLTPEFADHVVTKTSGAKACIDDFCGHVIKYNNNRILLQADKQRARDTFLVRHSLGNFEQSLGNLVTMPKSAEGQPTAEHIASRNNEHTETA